MRKMVRRLISTQITHTRISISLFPKSLSGMDLQNVSQNSCLDFALAHADSSLASWKNTIFMEEQQFWYQSILHFMSYI